MDGFCLVFFRPKFEVLGGLNISKRITNDKITGKKKKKSSKFEKKKKNGQNVLLKGSLGAHAKKLKSQGLARKQLETRRELGTERKLGVQLQPACITSYKHILRTCTYTRYTHPYFTDVCVPFFLPVDIHYTRSVRADSSPWKDISSVVTKLRQRYYKNVMQRGVDLQFHAMVLDTTRTHASNPNKV